MNGLIGLFILSVLLLSVSGQFPDISPSFSYRGNIVQTTNGQVITGTIIQATDITRRLQYYEQTYTLPGGSQTYITLYSVNDNTVYVTAGNGVCDITDIPTINLPNIWELYAAGTESPPGTFTYTQGNTTYELTIVNGVPAVFNTTDSLSETVTTVTNFEMLPPFSTFSLPSECSRFTCTACYNSPGQFPNLSPSYSYRGTILQTVNGQVSTGTTIQAFDLTRRLVYLELTTVTGGISQTNISLYSENDNVTYISVNGLCNETTDSYIIAQLDINIWGPYAAGTESPVGTFTYTQNGTTRQLTIVNGVPAVFIDTNSFSVTVITVTNFEMPPAFSTFCLPSECSRFNCTACYNSAVSVSISVLLLLTTLLLYLFSTH